MDKKSVKFSLKKFEKLIINLGWDSLDDWIGFWKQRRDILSIHEFWNSNVNEDWIWGLALPILSQALQLKNNFSERKIIGISALPGTGKTTLGKWLEEISLRLKFKIAVISIDDFYLPSNEMKLAINNNPWNVSRGFPGSHSVELMYEKLIEWKQQGNLNVPVFDKSLRNGLGDRAYWRSDTPDLLIVEGWFLGVRPLSYDIEEIENTNSTLNKQELKYRMKIQKNLEEYKFVWKLIDKIWHLKPLEFNYMNLWKSNQEKEMLLNKGSALKDLKLTNFLRMLNVSIPHESFDQINSDVLLLINQNRILIDVGLNE